MVAQRQPFLLVFVFAVVCVLSAMALVYTKHESRKLFVELEGLTQERDALNIEWGQLQIEQSTWAQHARIEQVAAEDLARREAQPGEKLAVIHSGLEGATVDAWIGFYEESAANNAYLSYTFLNNLVNNTYDVPYPRRPGRY